MSGLSLPRFIESEKTPAWDVTMQTILSYGMGVESTAVLVRWVREPNTRPCPLEDLIVITSQVGDEYEDTGHDITTYVLPLMQRHRIRYVQVARSGHLESDGITILDDSRQPQTVFLRGAYKLSDELRRNGTVPQFGGAHRCALKFKAWVIEQWLEDHLRAPARHAFGYNADESGRIAKSEFATSERIAFGFNADESERIERSREYNTATRQAFYPLRDWGWNRQACTDFLFSVFGIVWKRSACVYCPFNVLGPEGLQRHRLHPEQVGDAMAMEHVSLALNPRGTLYKKNSLIEIATATGNEEAFTRYHHRIDSGRWAIYRVRRIYSAKGRADRAVENFASFAHQESAEQSLQILAAELGLPVERLRGIPYVWRERRRETVFPTREDFLTVAPAAVDDKARYGLPWFEQKWTSPQLRLF